MSTIRPHIYRVQDGSDALRAALNHAANWHRDGGRVGTEQQW